MNDLEKNTPRIYPRKAWVLMPSFKPQEVEIVKPYGSWVPFKNGI